MGKPRRLWPASWPHRRSPQPPRSQVIGGRRVPLARCKDVGEKSTRTPRSAGRQRRREHVPRTPRRRANLWPRVDPARDRGALSEVSGSAVRSATLTSAAGQKSGHVLGDEAPGRQGARRAHTGRMQPTSNAAGRDGSAARTCPKFSPAALGAAHEQRGPRLLRMGQDPILAAIVGDCVHLKVYRFRSQIGCACPRNIVGVAWSCCGDRLRLATSPGDHAAFAGGRACGREPS
jgi:hypothetical protein